MAGWNIISNHGLVLLHLWKNPRSTARQVAAMIPATEWTVHRILADLEAAGYIERQREGRSNVYQVNGTASLRHGITRHVMLKDLLELLALDSAA